MRNPLSDFIIPSFQKIRNKSWTWAMFYLAHLQNFVPKYVHMWPAHKRQMISEQHMILFTQILLYFRTKFCICTRYNITHVHDLFHIFLKFISATTDNGMRTQLIAKYSHSIIYTILIRCPCYFVQRLRIQIADGYRIPFAGNSRLCMRDDIEIMGKYETS